MKTSHAFGVAAILAVAAIFGFLAATKTTGLRSATPTASTSAFAARAHRLDRVEAALHRALRAKPPALPRVPAARPAAPVPRVVYARPAPIVVVKHHAGSEGEHEGGGGGDD